MHEATHSCVLSDCAGAFCIVCLKLHLATSRCPQYAYLQLDNNFQVVAWPSDFSISPADGLCQVLAKWPRTWRTRGYHRHVSHSMTDPNHIVCCCSQASQLREQFSESSITSIITGHPAAAPSASAAPPSPAALAGQVQRMMGVLQRFGSLLVQAGSPAR